MRYKIDHDYHIHSHLSLCSDDPLQTPEAIFEYAKERKLSSICITDHYWDSAVEGASDWYKKQNFEHLSLALPLPQADGIRFMFGCEGEMNKQMNISVPSSRFDDFDFIIIPTTHLHMSINIESEHKADIEKKAELWVSQKPEARAAEDQAGSLPALSAQGALSVPSHCDHHPPG